MPTCSSRDGGAGDVARAAAGAAVGEVAMGRGWKECIIVVVVVVIAQDKGWNGQSLAKSDGLEIEKSMVAGQSGTSSSKGNSKGEKSLRHESPSCRHHLLYFGSFNLPLSKPLAANIIMVVKTANHHQQQLYFSDDNRRWRRPPPRERRTTAAAATTNLLTTSTLRPMNGMKCGLSRRPSVPNCFWRWPKTRKQRTGGMLMILRIHHAIFVQHPHCKTAAI